MSDPNVVHVVARMAADMQARDDVSMKTLLEASGYLNTPDLVTEELLAAEFVRHPELVESWARESDDTRCDRAWYFNPRTGTVGLVPGGPKYEFETVGEACACYVKRVVEQMRGFYGNEWPPFNPTSSPPPAAPPTP